MIDREILLRKVREKKDTYVEFRRMFHQIPELGFEEKETTEKICQILQEMHITPIRMQPTGVIAYIGPETGDTIALRADIDGLPVKEETGVAYQSIHEGVMHACGHDGHIAGLLGTASILKELENDLSVRVKCIFQPSEENTLGAMQMIRQGVLEDVDCIFGLHLFSDMNTGMISIEKGPRMAQTDRFSITFRGKGGHAGKPHQCIDATVMAADFVMSVQSIVAREVDPAESAVITIGSMHSGRQYNVISGEAKIEGTCRSFRESIAKHLKEALECRAENIAKYYGGEAEIIYSYGSHPPVENDAILSEQIAKTAEELFGKHFEETAPLMLGDDFSWYQKEIPGVYAFVGCHDPRKKEYFPNHHPCFQMDESALTDAVLLHLSAVFSMEKNKKIVDSALVL